MKFIEDDQFHIVMDRPVSLPCPAPGCAYYKLPLEDLNRISNLGIRLISQYAEWRAIEPSSGKYDWSGLDECIERSIKAKMKVILSVPHSIPLWFPDDWYIQEIGGRPMRDCDMARWQGTWGCLSYWCDAAQNYQHDFIRKVMSRYPSDDVLCIDSICKCGEAFVPLYGCYLFDPHAIESHKKFLEDRNRFPNPCDFGTQLWLFKTFKDRLIERQKIFASHPSKELFCNIHPEFMEMPAMGMSRLTEYFDALIEAFPDHKIYSIFYTYYLIGLNPRVRTVVHQLMDKGVRCFVGSEWTSGLSENTPKLISEGLRGFITAPLHELIHRSKTQQSDFDYFSQSRQLILNHKTKS